MSRHGILIPVDGPPRAIALPETDELAFLQGIVGGYIEPVRLDARAVMFVDEEATLKKPAPRANLVASNLANHHANVAGLIRGPAIIVGPEADELSGTPAREWWDLLGVPMPQEATP